MDERKPIVLVIRTLSRMIRREADGCAGRHYLESLTGTNGWIIGYLAKQGDRPVFQRDIEQAFSLRRSTVSRVISQMEQKGLIERHEVEEDRRLKKLVLTEKSLQIHKMVKADLDVLENKLICGISSEELRLFLDISDKMISNLGGCREER